MPDILTTPVTEPSAWLADDVRADDRWRMHFDQPEIDELENMVAFLLARGREAVEFGRDEIGELPLVEARIAKVLEELEHGRGFVLIKGLDVDRYDRREIATLYWIIGQFLGDPVHHSPAGDMIGEVRDQGLDYNDPLVRGYKSNQALGFHCDGADLVSLLCLQTAKSGGESLLCSSMALFNEILAHHPEYLPVLFEGFHYNLRGEGEKGESYPVTRHKVPVFSFLDGRLSCRFLRKAILEGQKFVGEPLDGLALEAVETMNGLAGEDRFRYDMVFERGDIQVLNNYMILHARGAFEDWPEPERKRNLLRMWINQRGGRALDPQFADRYNMGPRKTMRLRGRSEAA